MSNELPAMHPELAQKVASYIKETDALITELKSERDALLTKTASLEKNASGAQLPVDKVANLVDQVVRAGFLKQADREAAIKAISEQPVNSLLSFVEKLASKRISAGAAMPVLGRAVGQETESGAAAGGRESDRVFEQRFNHLRA